MLRSTVVTRLFGCCTIMWQKWAPWISSCFGKMKKERTNWSLPLLMALFCLVLPVTLFWHWCANWMNSRWQSESSRFKSLSRPFKRNVCMRLSELVQLQLYLQLRVSITMARPLKFLLRKTKVLVNWRREHFNLCSTFSTELQSALNGKLMSAATDFYHRSLFCQKSRTREKN